MKKKQKKLVRIAKNYLDYETRDFKKTVMHNFKYRLNLLKNSDFYYNVVRGALG